MRHQVWDEKVTDQVGLWPVRRHLDEDVEIVERLGDSLKYTQVSNLILNTNGVAYN